MAKVRENLKTMDKKLAADKAVRDCISEGILADVLSEERAAVMLEAITTFDEKLYEEGLREEIREEVREEIREEVREEMRAVVDARDREIDAKKREISEMGRENARLLAWARKHGYEE